MVRHKSFSRSSSLNNLRRGVGGAMKRRVCFLAVIVLTWLTLQVSAIEAANINLLDYWFSKGVGDQWTYTYTQPPGIADFTVSITLVTTDPYAGKYRLGDYHYPDGSTLWKIIDWVTDWIYMYYDSQHGVYDPVVALYTIYPLETLIDMGQISPNCPWYFQKMASFTVPAGTFQDILVQIVVDKSFGPTPANDLFGLDHTKVPYGVTHVNWYARGVGELQNMDFDELGNIVYTYQLKSTNVTPRRKGLATIYMLLLDQ